MSKYHIALTDDERAALRRIDLRVVHTNHDERQAAFDGNDEPILALVKSLSDRDAVPDVRLRYWNNPEYHNGRIKASHKGLFERNGCRGSDIYTHPSFIKYLRYFLFGAELSDPVIAAFEEKVGDPQWVSSSDVVPIGKAARQLARQHSLDHDAPEEFFKLCLDMGLGLSRAQSVRRSVCQIR